MNGELEAEFLQKVWCLVAEHLCMKENLKQPAYLEKIKAFDINTIPVPADLKCIAEKLLPSKYCFKKMDI